MTTRVLTGLNVEESLVEQLADLRSWNEGGVAGTKVTVFDYVCFNATPDLLVAFASLLFPSLVRHEGYYFIRTVFSADVFEQWKEKLETTAEIQRVMNHIHLRQIFQGQEISNDLANGCAAIIRDVWNASFASLGLQAEVHGRSFSAVSVTLLAKQ